eukprot:XP_017448532.1 PREDICTED: transcriptional enhancer factor TEF-3-like isoform X2 [Rattus norvegicus]
MDEEGSAFYGVSSQYESMESMIITCSSKICSFVKQVVEKVETEFARYENGHYLYRIHRSPLCEYMINFIHKLKHLPEKYMMNFTILQVRHAADAHKGVHQWVVPMASLSRVLTFTFSTAGCHQPRHTGDLAVYCICLRSFSQ